MRGAPGRIRTCNLRSRNPLRYPLRHGGKRTGVYLAATAHPAFATAVKGTPHSEQRTSVVTVTSA